MAGDTGGLDAALGRDRSMSWRSVWAAVLGVVVVVQAGCAASPPTARTASPTADSATAGSSARTESSPVVAAPTQSRLPAWVPFLGRKKSKQAVAVPPPPPASPVRRALPPDDPDVLDRVVAIVNNDAITLTELQESILYYKAENKGQNGDEADLQRRLIDRLIESRLQLQEAAREQVVAEESELADELAALMKRTNAKTPDEFEAVVRQQGLTMEAVKKRIREQIMIAKVIRRKVAFRVSVTEQEIDRYLTDNRQKLETGLTYHARHILIPPDGELKDAAWGSARERAEEAYGRLLAGEDFAQVAKEVSRDGTAADGGDLGTLRRGELAEDIESEILKLRPGEVGAPFRTELGYHIVRLESKETLAGEALLRTRQQIRDILFREKYQARLDVWLGEIKQRAVIEVRI
jgi:peptidyl-prolyl cis-trans isomerase SurA